MASVIIIGDLPYIPNACNQLLREVWASPCGRMSLAHVEMSPGNASQPHFHRGLTELYYILSGAGEMVLNGEIVSVRAGMAIPIPPETVHYLRNTGSAPLIHLVVCTPLFDPNDVILVEEPYRVQTNSAPQL